MYSVRTLFLTLLLALPLAAQTFKAISNNQEPAGSGNTVATASTLNVATNDAVFACVGTGTSTFTVSGVTDGASNAMTLVKRGTGASVGTVELWAKYGATANATATFTATWSASASADFRWIRAMTYSGVATSSAGDQTSCEDSGCNTVTTSAAISSQNVTTTQAAELLLQCTYMGSGADFTAASSFNMRGATIVVDTQVADRVVAATGSYPGGNTSTLSTSVGHISVFGTFKAPASSTATTRARGSTF